MAIPQNELQQQQAVQQAVLAGMRLMYDKKTFPMLLNGMKSATPMPQKLAMETAGIIKLVDEHAPQGLQPEVVAQASVMLLLELVDFMSQAGQKPTEKDAMDAIGMLKTVLVKVFSKSGKAVKKPAPQQAMPQGAANGVS
jgi:hypothetical protein